MPAKPLTADQAADAGRLKALFKKWQQARKDAGSDWSQDAFADLMPFGQSALNQYLNAKIPLNAEASAQFAKVLGVEIDEFSPSIAAEITALLASARSVTEVPAIQAAEGDDATAANEDVFVQVRRVGVRFANGHGSLHVDDDEMPPLSFRTDFLRKIGIAPGKAVVVEADGISNEPKIVDGSVVLVDTGSTAIVANEFYAFRAEGELLIKRLEELQGIGVLATAENPNFKPKSRVYREGVDDFEVIGRAVWTGALL